MAGVIEKDAVTITDDVIASGFKETDGVSKLVNMSVCMNGIVVIFGNKAEGCSSGSMDAMCVVGCGTEDDINDSTLTVCDTSRVIEDADSSMNLLDDTTGIDSVELQYSPMFGLGQEQRLPVPM